MSPETPRPIQSIDELRATGAATIPWLWEGFLAAGSLTLLTAQWKAGKTTLLSVLLNKLQGGGELVGRRVAPARAVVVSEEPKELWLGRDRTFTFGPHVGWMCQPFTYRPRLAQWLGLIEQIAERTGAGPVVVVIDALAEFLPGSENSAACVLDGLMPLKRLTSQGAAVLLLHHIRKGKTLAGQAARGSGALSGHVDIEIAMSGPPADDLSDRRRRLQVFSRFGLHSCTIELNSEGTDYVVCDSERVDEPLDPGWEAVREVLDEAPHKLKREEFLCRWPEWRRKPTKITLWRLLDQAVARGLVCRDGTGLKNDPHYFWLPGKVEEWQADPLRQFFYEHTEQEREQRRRGEWPPCFGTARHEDGLLKEEKEKDED